MPTSAHPSDDGTPTTALRARRAEGRFSSWPPGLVYTQQVPILRIMISRLPVDVLTLHAELVAMLVALEGDRSWSHLSGSFSTKTVAGHQYLYFQYSDPGGHRRQLAIGRQTDALRKILRRQQTDRTAVEQERAAIERLAELLRVGGASTLPHAVGRVLRALADAALFRLGGVLVGSYAFFLLGNLLGVHWPEAAWRTQDVDLASHVQIATTTATADVPATLSSLQMGFVPVPQLDPRHPSTSFKVRGKELRVDLLTPGRDGQDAPVFIPRLQAAAAPIKYLSLLMDEAQPAPAISGRGTTLVVVPTPARFALHKLLVSQTRSLVQQTRSGKELQQAALLLEVLAEDRPTDIEVAARGFAKAGPAVTSKVLRALATVERRSPDAAAGVELARAALHS
ncbi:MAG: nucleotidyltransferase domain-containing protein [Planctomycetes bacterium]|nr:nucleotidyltransferase domain-containing protein [Planctomycetota bacterium]